jgi:hypothetical protein
MLLIGLLAAVGCQKSSPKGGMPAAGNKEAFTIQVPATAVSVKQGDTDQVAIGIKRGGEFTNDVKVELILPPGVTATPAAFTFQGPNNDQKVTLVVSGEAVVGTHVVKVNAMPSAGQATSAQFDVAVKAKS